MTWMEVKSGGDDSGHGSEGESGGDEKKDGSMTSWLDPMVPRLNMVGAAGEVPGRRILSMGPAELDWVLTGPWIKLSYLELQHISA